jgi:two-component system phosphate regulon response regulator PhoB
MKLLLVEDDRHLGETIKDELIKKEYQVDWAQDISATNVYLKQSEYDLAIIDLNLPDGKGFELVKPLQCPVIIMSALSDPENRLKGAELGAIDFIPKPFLLQELFLKIDRALGEKLEESRVWQRGEVILDLNKRQIQNGPDTHLLNKRDFRVLDILSTQAPQVVSRDQIIDYVYGKDQSPSHRTIDNAVVGLRQMLGDDGQQWIRSVRGEGYQWILKETNNGQ